MKAVEPMQLAAQLAAPSACAESRAPGAASGSSLDLTGVRKRYGEHVALHDISLQIIPGEFVTLLGPSGSGKTTTLNLIAGFLEPDAGEILLDGKPISKLPPHKRNIGMVFQNYALFPHMTAYDNIVFPLKQRRIPRSEQKRRVNEVLEIIRLGEFAKRYPRELSGGQQQRVALARAIVFNPRVLLMDEPLGALDKKLREALQLEIKRIHRELGITFIYVTHDQEEALVMSDRIAIFNSGRIEQMGRSGELYEQPSNAFVANFIGESNLFEGSIERDGSGFILRRGPLMLRLAGAVAPGAGAIVVRPERLRLAERAAAPVEDHNEIDAVVKDVIYLGNTRKYLLHLEPDGTQLVARAQVGDEPQAFAAGDEIRVTWHVESGVILPHAEGDEA